MHAYSYTLLYATAFTCSEHLGTTRITEHEMNAASVDKNIYGRDNRR